MRPNILFIEKLLRLIPQLNSIYEEHLADNNTLLPHVFMGDVTRFVVAESGKLKSRRPLFQLLQCLEEELENGAEETQEMIVVSFVENLADESLALSLLRPHMGPKLTAAVDVIL